MKEKRIKFGKIEDVPYLTVSLGTTRVNLTGKWRSFRPVIDYLKCTRCMTCWKFCPDASIIKEKNSAKDAPNDKIKKLPAPVIDYDFCKGCGICAEECPVKCIEMKPEKK